MATFRKALSFALVCALLSYEVVSFVPAVATELRVGSRLSTHFARDHYAEDMFYHDKKVDFSDGAPVVNVENRMEKMVKCAESQVQCTTEEIDTMIQDLERLNHDCGHLLSESSECDLEKVEGREVLKHALTLKKELQLVNEKMKSIQSLNGWRKKGGSSVYASRSNSVQDHSFSHYVDYRDIGAYESH